MQHAGSPRIYDVRVMTKLAVNDVSKFTSHSAFAFTMLVHVQPLEMVSE